MPEQKTVVSGSGKLFGAQQVHPPKSIRNMLIICFTLKYAMRKPVHNYVDIMHNDRHSVSCRGKSAKSVPYRIALGKERLLAALAFST